MKALLAILIFFSAVFVKAQVSQADIDYTKSIVYPATALLYAEDEHGGMKMRCTATAKEKTATGYIFVSAAHCDCEDDEDAHTVSPEKAFFYITMDNVEHKDFMQAKVIGCGYRHAGDDVSLLEVKTDTNIPTVDIGHDPEILDAVVSVGSPLGLGKQVFTGNVSAAKLERPVVVDDINWTGVALLQLFGTDGGSSGAAVVCLNQHAVCGFIVGTLDKTSTALMPVSRLTKLERALKDGKYKQWRPDPDEPKKSKEDDDSKK